MGGTDPICESGGGRIGRTWDGYPGYERSRTPDRTSAASAPPPPPRNSGTGPCAGAPCPC
eukprot:7300248-Pyramimonas_sp.AAC.1